MATSTQSNIGLRPTQAVTEDFGGMYLDAVQTQKQDEERKRLEEERKQARKDKFSEKYGINEDDYVLPDTEFRTINDVGLEAITQYRDLRYDVEKEFENDPTNMELKKKLGNIDNAAKRLKQATLSIQKVGEKYLKMMDEDKISGLHENKWRDILVGHDTGNMKVKIDQESANQKYVFYNEKGELAEVQTLKELMDGHIIERVDVDENIDSFMKGIGKYVVDKNTGGYIVTEDIFGQKQLDAALGQINPLLENDDTMADLYYQYTGEKSDQEENFSPQQKEQVKDWLLGKIKGRYSEKTSMQQKREPSQSSSGSGNKNITVDNLQLATDTTTNQPLIENGKVAFTLPKGVQIGAADKYT